MKSPLSTLKTLINLHDGKADGGDGITAGDCAEARAVANAPGTDLAAENARLREALKPFADLEIALYSASGLHAFTESGIHKIPEEWQPLIPAILTARAVIAPSSGHRKAYRIGHNVGNARYTVSAHDGVQTHKDGSPFYGIEIFSNRKGRDAYVTSLRKQGYAAE